MVQGEHGAPRCNRNAQGARFCAHSIEQNGILEITDATEDPRFSDNPLVLGEPNIRFYAGATLQLSNGANAGTLCVIDRKPRKLTTNQKEILLNLSRAVVQVLEVRRINNSLAISESRFRAVSDASPMGLFRTDAEGACTHANPRWQQIFGLSHDDALGHGWSQTLYDEDKNRVFNEWNDTAAKGRNFDMEFRIGRDDAVITHVRAVSRPVFDTTGKLSGHVGLVEDITEKIAQRSALEDAYERIALATENGNIGIWDWNLERNTLHWTPEMFQLHGLPGTSGYVDFERWMSSLHPEDRHRTRALLRNSIEEGNSIDTEYRSTGNNNTTCHLRSSAKITRNPDGKAIRLLGVNWDVTPLRKITAELAEQHELLRVTLSSIGDAVITTDAQGIVTWLNPIAERMTEWTHQEAEGQPLVQIFNIINEHTRLVTPNPVESCLEHGRIVGLANHTVLISRSGKEYGIADSAAPIKNKSNDILGVVLVFHDVTEQRRLSIEMSYRATHDELTGLVNRSEFEAQLSLSLDRASEFDKSHALMYIDLDRFKLVNDTCGHSAGDLLLQQVSKIMQKCVRTSDTFARIGGDEFGVILEDCSTEQAHRVARLICEHVHEYRFTHSDQQFRIGTSIGLVPLDKRWSTTAAAMQAADRSCYAAKEAGRNRVNLWVDTDKTIQIRQKDMQWATRLQQAVDHDDQFVLYAQRIEGLHSNTSGLHAEVLLRLKDTDGSLIPPNIFLRAAERFHLATLVDRWVLQRAINHLMRLSDISAIEQLCINLSGQSIGDRKFHDEVIDLLSYAGEDICRKICLEITETAAVTRIADSTVFIDNVRELGVQIALDDFGAGASSFGYLKVLKVDILKIDGQYITGMMDDRLDDAAVRCFVDVAKIMGLKTVAEFVKTPQILDRSKELGIDYAQGFLLHEPERLEVVVA